MPSSWQGTPTGPRTAPNSPSRPWWSGTDRWSSASAGRAPRRACRRGRLPGHFPRPGQESAVALGEGLAGELAARRGASRRIRGQVRRGPPPPDEQQLAEARGPACEILPDQPRYEAWAILSEQIARLPEKYRAPVVLCYLEGMTYQAAAASLGVTEDAVRGRLRGPASGCARAWPAEGSRSPPSSRPRGRRSRGSSSHTNWCEPRPAPQSTFRRAGRRVSAPSPNQQSFCTKGRAGP